MAIDDEIKVGIEDLKNQLEAATYGNSTTSAPPGNTTSTTSTGTIWIDTTGTGGASSDVVFSDGLGNEWAVAGGSATLQLGNVELMITEGGEAKLSVTEGEDVTDYYFSQKKVKSFLEKFADVKVTGKK